MTVSICMITYNHGKYIEQAIKGIIEQDTHYSFELVIGEDSGSDDTRSICEKYAREYPGIIRLLPSDKRYGMIDNFIRTYQACRGKYIATCEGDDYWTDKKKLTRQIDFLENNPGYAICCHDVLFEINNKKYRSHKWNTPVDSDINYLLQKGNFLFTVSAIVRNHPDIIPFIEKFRSAPFGDYLLYLAAARFGKIKFMSEKMAVYRLHGRGAWSGLGTSEAFFNRYAVIEMLYRELPAEFHNGLSVQLLDTLEATVRKQPELLEDERLKRVFRLMNIAPFIIDYMKFSVNERSDPAYYSQNVQFKILFKGVQEKIKSKIFMLLRN